MPPTPPMGGGGGPAPAREDRGPSRARARSGAHGGWRGARPRWTGDGRSGGRGPSGEAGRPCRGTGGGTMPGGPGAHPGSRPHLRGGRRHRGGAGRATHLRRRGTAHLGGRGAPAPGGAPICGGGAMRGRAHLRGRGHSEARPSEEDREDAPIGGGRASHRRAPARRAGRTHHAGGTGLRHAGGWTACVRRDGRGEGRERTTSDLASVPRGKA